MITKPTVLRAVCAMLIGNLCATHSAYAQHTPAPAPTLTRSAAAPIAPVAAPGGGLSMAASSVAIVGKLNIDNVITVAGETVKLHAVFSRVGVPVNGASLQFRIDGASVGQGVTSANGATDVSYKLVDSLALGAHTILVTFPGDSKTGETTASAKLTVLKSVTSLTAPYLFEYGPPFATIRGTLRGASDDVRLAKRKVMLKDHGATVESYTTSYSGDFVFNIEPSAGHKYTVEFDGETNYLGTTKAAEYAGPKGGLINLP